jgi:hypothetical protein
MPLNQPLNKKTRNLYNLKSISKQYLRIINKTVEISEINNKWFFNIKIYRLEKELLKSKKLYMKEFYANKINGE